MNIDTEQKFLQVEGVFVPDSGDKREVSYPTDAASSCFQVEDKSFWFRYRNKVILYFFEKFHSSADSKRVLDIGGGNGFVSMGLKERGYKVTLVEPGRGAWNGARRGIEEVYSCRVTELPRTLVADAAGLFDVIEHIPDPVSFLQDIGKHLTSGGKLFFTVPAYKWLWSDEDILAGHFRRYTVKSLKKELNEADFDLIYSTYFFSVLIPIIFIFRSVPTYLRRKSERRISHNVERDHVASGFIDKIVSLFLSIEFSLLRLVRIPTGASILIIAQKKRIEHDF